MASTISPHFWRNPIRYARWAAHEKPAIYYSVLIGGSGPVLLFTVPTFRRWRGTWTRRPGVPGTYPVPSGPRKKLDGYADP